MNQKKRSDEVEVYTDEQINELADWFESLTAKQLFFMKKKYEQLLKSYANEAGSEHVH